MLSNENFLLALIPVSWFLTACLTGLFMIYQAKKSNARLLFYYGIGMILSGFTELGSLIDFITILLTNNNMDGQLLPYLTWTTFPISAFFFYYVILELILPEKKWYILSIFLSLIIIWELDLYIFHWTDIVIEYPTTPGEGLLRSPYVSSFTSRVWIFIFSSSVIFSLGILYKRIGTKGVIKKKYFLIGLAGIIFGVTNLLRVMVAMVSHIVTFLIFCTPVLIYLGLREEPEKGRKIQPLKEIIVKDSLFRISQKPDQITEEEITYYKEQKICLVCKGKAGGFNTYICTKCDVLYCENCARALTNLENACWVCGELIDKSKPIMLRESETQKMDVDFFDETEEKTKTDKNSLKSAK